MLTYICDTHPEYPKRISANNLYKTEYKDSRPFFFHKKIINNSNLQISDSLIPIIDDFKNKFSHITNDYILNSLSFEFCDYFIKYINGEEMSFALLPINPYYPTGIGGRGLLDKWGPNHFADPIIITYDDYRNIYQLIVIQDNNKSNSFLLPGGYIDSNQFISEYIRKEFKDETDFILNTKYSKFIYSGYVNDSRNTDHAWIETIVFLFSINKFQRKTLLNIFSTDNSINIKLIDIDENNNDFKNLNRNHKEFVQMSLKCI